MDDTTGASQRWRGQPALAAGLLALGLTGCATLGLSPTASNADNADAMDNQRVDRTFRGDMLVSRIKPVRLRLPSGWQPAPTGTLHSNADLEAYNLDETMYLVVLGESRTEVRPGNLDEQASNYLQILKSGFAQVVDNQSRTEVTQVGGFPAVQYEVRGDVGQQTVAYLHTTVEMGDNYYQVVVWTPNNLHSANIAAMQSVVQEFREAQL
ncbi:MAG TPA: hypothetical protein VLS96_02390 [Nodosilinea sp.]|nr:hypothetical protein [Nodosilinea sp.]